MPHNIKNIAQLAPFAIFVAGVDTSLNRIGAACDAAYGLFFDSPELVSLSGSRKFHHSCVYSAGDHDAVYKVSNRNKTLLLSMLKSSSELTSSPPSPLCRASSKLFTSYLTARASSS